MKKWIFCALAVLFLTSNLFAVDEDTYVEFAADSVITAHELKGDPEAMNLWVDQMREKYPDFMNEDWQSFEDQMAQNSSLNARVYGKILERVKSEGYDAYIVDLGGGLSTIEIKD